MEGEAFRLKMNLILKILILKDFKDFKDFDFIASKYYFILVGIW